MEDVFKTIKETAQGQITEKKSKFYGFAIPIQSAGQVKEIVEKYRKEYYDARHTCWAYMLGHERNVFRANDDGEPSGTAGKPILGQINSNELTDILVIVIRYFGGIKLGTSGLIAAYKSAAAEAINNAEIIERTVDIETSFHFEYPLMNSVMKIIKDLNPEIISQDFEMDCNMTLRIRQAKYKNLRERLSKVETLNFIDK